SSSASTQPTGPAPRTEISLRIAIRVPLDSFLLQGLDIGDAFRRFRRDDFAAVRSDQRVVFDANADAAQRLGHVVRRADVEAGLNRKHHPGGERAPLPRALVLARI